MHEERTRIVVAGMPRVDELTAMALALWPDHEREEMAADAASWIASDRNEAFLALGETGAAGFLLMSIRTDYVEGSDGGPVGYVEGVYVAPEYRRTGVAKALLEAGERWAAERGCRQIGSDLELGNDGSYAFHLGVGFREANRIICLIKDLHPNG